jgi:hypothetical protein
VIFIKLVAFFFLGSFFCLSLRLLPLTPGRATGVSVLRSATIYNPLWWGLTVGVIAFAIARVYFSSVR